MTQQNGHVKEPPGRITTLTPNQEVILKQMWLDMLQYMGYIPKELSRVSSTVTSVFSYDSRMTRKTGILRRRTRVIESSVSSGENSLKNSLKGMSGAEFDKLLRICSRADDPDNTLLRFLRARKWDIGKGLAMLGHTIQWRKDNNVDHLISRGELLAIEDNDDGIMIQLKKGISQIHGVDKQGRPIVYVGVHLHKPKEQTAQSLEKFTIQTIENARLCLREGIDTATVIFDLSRFSLSNMNYHAVKYMADCFEAHYPESLGMVLIHKAPWIFSSIWKVIKNWLDPVVASKIQFTQKNEDLLKFIDADNLDKDLGGKRKWTYKYTGPKPGDNDLLKDTVTRQKLIAQRTVLFEQYYEATLHWCRTSNEESKAWLEKKLEISKALHENFWKLDPYIRASSILDRDGTFGYFHEELKDRTGVKKGDISKVNGVSGANHAIPGTQIAGQSVTQSVSERAGPVAGQSSTQPVASATGQPIAQPVAPVIAQAIPMTAPVTKPAPATSTNGTNILDKRNPTNRQHVSSMIEKNHTDTDQTKTTGINLIGIGPTGVSSTGVNTATSSKLSTGSDNNTTNNISTTPKSDVNRIIDNNAISAKNIPTESIENTSINGPNGYETSTTSSKPAVPSKQSIPSKSPTSPKSSSSISDRKPSSSSHLATIFGKGLQIIDEEGEEDVFYDVLTW